MHTPRKIALFGGTFDPVHAGHLHLAGLAQELLGLDEVRFIPCKISPHKSGKPPASVADRVKMLELATAEPVWAIVDDFEITQDTPSFSYLTAQAMHARFPADRLFWIMGGDQWRNLPQWKHPEVLAELLEFIILSRGASLQKNEHFRSHIITGEHPASATAIREAIASGEPSHRWLHPEVAKWILEKGLYE